MLHAATAVPIDARAREIRLRNAAIDAMIAEGLALAGISNAGSPSLADILVAARIPETGLEPHSRRAAAAGWTADRLLADPRTRDAIAELIALPVRRRPSEIARIEDKTMASPFFDAQTAVSRGA